MKVTARILLAIIAIGILTIIYTSDDEFVQFIGHMILFCAFMWLIILLFILAFPKSV